MTLIFVNFRCTISDGTLKNYPVASSSLEPGKEAYVQHIGSQPNVQYTPGTGVLIGEKEKYVAVCILYLFITI